MFLVLDKCSSLPSYIDDDFQEVDIKEEPLEPDIVSYGLFQKYI